MKLDSWELMGKLVEVDGMKSEGKVVSLRYDQGGAGLLYDVEVGGKIIHASPVEIKEILEKSRPC